MTYDTGALIAAERNDRRLWALHRRALERGLVVTSDPDDLEDLRAALRCALRLQAI